MTLELRCPEDVNHDGAYRIEWEGAGPDAVYLLHEGGSLLYEGKDLATTVTGRAQGSYAYALQVSGGEGAARCDVEVQPHSLMDAFALFGLGAVVFVCTLVVVVKGHREHRAGRIG